MTDEMRPDQAKRLIEQAKEAAARNRNIHFTVDKKKWKNAEKQRRHQQKKNGEGSTDADT